MWGWTMEYCFIHYADSKSLLQYTYHSERVVNHVIIDDLLLKESVGWLEFDLFSQMAVTDHKHVVTGWQATTILWIGYSLGDRY